MPLRLDGVPVSLQVASRLVTAPASPRVLQPYPLADKSCQPMLAGNGGNHRNATIDT
jgi:hypothetical protein